MSRLCVRIDLDYVPWDSPDAQQFGHGEPAMLLRLLDLARRMGERWHFFASERNLRAFPTGVDAVLNDGHDLDYLAKHPTEPARFAEAVRLAGTVGHELRGWAVRGSWPVDGPDPGMAFYSGPAGSAPPGARLFETRGRSLHEAVRAGGTLRSWLDAALREIRSDAEMVTLVVSPQVLARIDPRLAGFVELLGAARLQGRAVRTLRQVLESD